MVTKKEILPDSTIVEVVAIKILKKKKKMTIKEWKSLKKESSWTYTAYQVGFNSDKEYESQLKSLNNKIKQLGESESKEHCK